MQNQKWYRRIAAIALVSVLGALLVWQYQREQKIRACQATGGIWDGSQSICRPVLPAPILKRDGLQRI